MTDQPATLAAALAAFQAKLPALAKNKTAKVRGTTKDGKPYEYEYGYADLADVSATVMPLLGAVGLSFTARPMFNESGRFVLAYKLLHASGDFEAGEYPLPQQGTSQEMGSAITYARRYALSSVTGVAAEKDDDGKIASERPMHVAEQAWDPIEQQVYVDAFLAEIEDAKDGEALRDIARRVQAGKRNRELSPASYDHLVKAGAARKGELNGAAMQQQEVPA